MIINIISIVVPPRDPELTFIESTLVNVYRIHLFLIVVKYPEEHTHS